MSEDPRDTKFKGFAMQVMAEMANLHGYIDISGYWTDEDLQEYAEIIARRVYDLVQHACQDIYNQQNACQSTHIWKPSHYEPMTADTMVRCVKDLTELPTSSN